MKYCLLRALTAILCSAICMSTLSACDSRLQPMETLSETKSEEETEESKTNVETSDKTEEAVSFIPLGTKGEIRLRAVSFNLNTYNPSAEGAMNWHNRKDALCAYILSLDADVICTQETPETYREYLAEKLGHVYDWEHFNHNMLFFRRERFEKLDFTPRYYGTDPTAKAPAFDASMERNFITVRLREKETGAEFYLVGTHFDHKGLKARIFAAKQLLETFSKSTIPYIIMGDFNSTEESYAYKDLTKLFLDSQKIATVTDQGRSFNKWGELSGEGLPVDFVFVSPVNIRAHSYKILRDTWGENFLYSDHYPVCVELTVAY